jgi:transcriptional regulator with XRE-family HTH domain
MAGSVKLGRKLKAARKAKRMTLMEVQKKAGVSATHISQIERGMTSPTVGVLQKLAKALDTRASSFLDDGPARRRK